MKLDQLKMFVTVAKLGSLSQASARLHKTQPAISQSIRQLEKGFNLPLFNRSGYRLELTEAGKTLYQKASNLLDEASNLQQAADHIALGNELSITIAIEASFDLKGILPLLENLQRQFPNTQIIIEQEYLSGALEALQNETATLCITPSIDLLETELKTEKHRLTGGFLVNVASPKLINRNDTLKNRQDLLKECQIIVKDSGSASKNLEWGVIEGQNRWYVNDYHTKKMLIENGMGWGKLPSYLVEDSLRNGTLIMLSLNDIQNKTPMDYFIMKDKSKPLGPVAQATWEQFERYSFD
ncbi:LysR family transcriptional regulator [Marinomonas posidonica]|uniref:Transcriptional regulator, LysR family n=1 Tax=Marinomonas posidonica (strain CECT 7376 / NCIMB 14433 / IVIA-Po-181) TaxID=491952 RepID=F6CUD5_MARPP|nr:LysR family transcriptional regulator [Marinomonas posidonica]AEF55254.1 transcriptional regulator, LysR family [Marinomonas posidonica IVIA-Po-181]